MCSVVRSKHLIRGSNWTVQRLIRATLSIAGVLSLAGLVVAYYSHALEPRWLRRRLLSVPLAHLPDHLCGLRILHLSDLHYRRGDPVSSGVIRRAAAWAAAMQPDIVCLTGDFVETDRDIEVCLAHIISLKARYGCFAVFGNHDHGRGLDRPEPPTTRWKASLAEVIGTPWKHKGKSDPPGNDMAHLESAITRTGIRLLTNSHCRVDLPGGPLWIVGVDDPHQEHDDIRRAVDGIPAGAPLLLLAHSQDVLTEVTTSPRPLLVLTGHTHGGQIRIPGWPPFISHTRLQLADPRGLVAVGGLSVHISPGVGASTPLRFGCRPEVTLLTLDRGADHRGCQHRS